MHTSAIINDYFQYPFPFKVKHLVHKIKKTNIGDVIKSFLLHYIIYFKNDLKQVINY